MNPPATTTPAPGLPPELRALLETRDPAAFEASLDALYARRQQDLFRALGHLARDLHKAIGHLSPEPGDASGGAPHARRSLQEALAMSAHAAHDTLATAERLRPRARKLRDDADAVAATAAFDPPTSLRLAGDAARFADACLEDFTRLVERQSWQDLSGQRLQRVAAFIDKVEEALLQLVRLTGSVGNGLGDGEPPAPPVTTQDEVDRLLSDFGF